MLGNSANAITQYEGKASDIPKNALNDVALDAGIKIVFDDETELVIATSMFPYALYVSDCGFSEEFDQNIYESIPLK